MIDLLAELDKRGHHAQLSFNRSVSDNWVTLITVKAGDWNTIKMRSQLGTVEETRKLYNSLLCSFFRNGYKLISIK